jgi:hypothetical protein
LAGTQATRDLGNGQVVITLATALHGGPGGQLRIELTGTPLEDDGVALDSGTVTFTPAAGGGWTGPVDGLSGGEITATLHHGSQTVRCDASVSIDDDSEAVAGTVTLA